jgi:hypothetical protein
MFRSIWLIRNIGVRNTLLLIIFIFGGALVYEGFIAPKPPSYTRPEGYSVTTVCSTGGMDCDEYGYVRLWDNLEKTSSSFIRSPKAVFCVAVKSSLHSGNKYWWIDCGLWQGKELPVIEGWVQEENLEFGGWVESRKIY